MAGPIRDYIEREGNKLMPRQRDSLDKIAEALKEISLDDPLARRLDERVPEIAAGQFPSNADWVNFKAREFNDRREADQFLRDYLGGPARAEGKQS